MMKITKVDCFWDICFIYTQMFEVYVFSDYDSFKIYSLHNLGANSEKTSLSMIVFEFISTKLERILLFSKSKQSKPLYY